MLIVSKFQYIKVGQFEKIIKTIAEILLVIIENYYQINLNFFILIKEKKKLGAQ